MSLDSTAEQTRARRHKLTAEQVREIVLRRKSGETYRSLGAAFGCSASNICDITKGRSWKTVSGVAYVRPAARLSGKNHPLAKLTESQVLSILRRRQTGITYRDLAREFGVNLMTVCSICLGRTWTNVTGLKRVGPKYSRRKGIRTHEDVVDSSS